MGQSESLQIAKEMGRGAVRGASGRRKGCWWFFIWCLGVAFSGRDGGGRPLGCGPPVGFRSVAAFPANSSDERQGLLTLYGALLEKSLQRWLCSSLLLEASFSGGKQLCCFTETRAEQHICLYLRGPVRRLVAQIASQPQTQDGPSLNLCGVWGWGSDEGCLGG